MADAAKYLPVGGGNLVSDLRSLFSVLKTRRTTALAYGFVLAFVAFTVFLAFSPSPNASSPWFTNIFSSSASSTSTAGSYKSQLSSIFAYLFPNTSTPQSHYVPNFLYPAPPRTNTSRSSNTTSESPSLSEQTPTAASANNQTQTSLNSSEDNVPTTNHTAISQMPSNQTTNSRAISPPTANNDSVVVKNHTESPGKSDEVKALETNQTTNAAPAPTILAAPPPTVVVLSPSQNLSTTENSNSSVKDVSQKSVVSNNYTASLAKKQSNGTNTRRKNDDLIESLTMCDFYDGEWVKDDSYPLYKPGSCTLIDEQFSCIQNGRPDKDYLKYKWKPKGCNLPRLDGSRMLELLRGKRLAFVGDSLNRNMWESLICILKNSAKDKSKVYEVNGRVVFRGEASYSFIFKDYSFSVELYVSPFLVREWEMPDNNGTKRETLRLDLVGKSADQYKGADVIIFNTGHWWTHEKTSLGKDYYQEGSHVYGELNVLEAFRRALTTWSRWVDGKIDPSKSIVFFRGYSASHFSGGQWNSGGQCDSETEPITNEKYLKHYPSKMKVLEKVLKNMKTQVGYMNITRMTDFRKDGHPSIYRKQNLSPEERKSPLRFQDCSHWCLPGVPDAWNEILYAELLRKQFQDQHRR